MSVSVWRDEGGRTAAEGDVVIVGAGIAGLCAAYEALVKGLRPVVVDARDVAAGATGRNAGFAMTGLAESYADFCASHGRETARAAWAASQANLDALLELVARERIECDLVPCGSVVAAWTEREAEALANSAELLREDGFEAQWLDRDAVGKALGSPRFYCGVRTSKDHGIHPVKLARALAELVRSRGGVILEHHEVRALVEDSAGVRVETSRGAVKAPRALLCTNAYTKQIEPRFEGVVRPVRGQVCCTEPAPAGTIPALVYADDGFQYVRQLPDGRIVAGGWRRNFADVEVGYDEDVTKGVQDGIAGFLHEAWPATKSLVVTHRWSGIMGFSPDGLPLVGRLEGRPRVHYAVGFTGHGLGYALVVTRAALAMIAGEGEGGVFRASRLAKTP